MGNLDLLNLDETLLEELDMFKCGFSGMLNLTKLPNSLKKLNFAQNHFIGTPDLTKLPNSLKILRLNNNNFSGTIKLADIPILNSLEELGLSNSGLHPWKFKMEQN